MDLYDKYCEENNVPIEYRNILRYSTKKTADYQFFVLGNSFKELFQSLKKSVVSIFKK